MVNLACFALFAVATAVSMPSPHHAALAGDSSSTAKQTPRIWRNCLGNGDRAASARNPQICDV